MNISRKTEYKYGFHWLYLWSICYIIIVYAFSILLCEMKEGIFKYAALPLIIGLINFIIVIIGRKKIDRRYFLNCSIMIKYALIPYYIVGGLCVLLTMLSGLLLMALTAIIPQLIAALIVPVLALGMVVLGWIFMVGVAPFSMSYMIKSNKEGVHGKFFTVLGCICQFFFISDVIAIMILSLKEKKFVKLTVSIIIFYVILAIVFAFCLIAKIIEFLA